MSASSGRSSFLSTERRVRHTFLSFSNFHSYFFCSIPSREGLKVDKAKVKAWTLGNRAFFFFLESFRCRQGEWELTSESPAFLLIEQAVKPKLRKRGAVEKLNWNSRSLTFLPSTWLNNRWWRSGQLNNLFWKRKKGIKGLFPVGRRKSKI